MGTNTPLTITSFGYNHGTPRAPHVIDCRHLPNPHTVPRYRPRNGLDTDVAAWVLAHPATQHLIAATTPRLEATHHLAIGCNAGRHRSVAVAEELAHIARSTGRTVTVVHRDINPGAAPQAHTPAAWHRTSL
ncbi:RNA binding protein [Gordonia phage Tarzan]|uniref:RNA binding protein n=1 Tax=Gordonia phage Tarzan TaxID=3038367 RepID=A0AAF0GGZ6_9CAUD|nr:RNA binding protein [Gordonia phage Tarzan]WGH20097.1 RNA binding protein [Gordonia phage Tarzan]